LGKAGIPKMAAGGKVDFHSLRVSFVTNVIEAGASVKEAQVLARHSTPTLTLNVYARTRPERLVGVADAIGEGLRIGTAEERPSSARTAQTT